MVILRIIRKPSRFIGIGSFFIGWGDFLNDYEGIGGYEKFRDDLVLMYFADIAPAGTLAALEVVPLQILVRFNSLLIVDDIGWLYEVLDGHVS